HPGHVVDGERDPGQRLVLVGARDQHQHHQREDEREDEEADVAQGPQQLEAGVGERDHESSRESSAVSSRKAASRPAPLTSMACMSGWAAIRVRRAVSESLQVKVTVSPRISTRVTPGTRPSRTGSAPGSVAAMVRLPTMALIVVVDPSATTRPWAM